MGIAERKEREKQQRREEIVNAAEKVFFRMGFHQCTMDDIAREAELSKGTLYLYFKSKLDLHIAVAHGAISMLRGRTSEAEEMGGNALEKLQRMAQACITFYREYPDHMKAIMSLEAEADEELSMSTEDVQDMIYNDSTVGTVVQVVEQGVEEKLIRDDLSPVLIAHTLWMSVLSVIRFVSSKQGLLELLDVSPTTVFESHFELVINGIRT